MIERPHRLPFVLAALVLLLGVALRLQAFAVPDRSPDERLYAGFAHGITQHGLAWFPQQVSLYTNDGDVEYPWVHRAGYLVLVALAQRVLGQSDPMAGEALATVASVLALALCGALAWRVVSPWAAPVAMLFMACSPLDLAIARRAWQDTVIALFTLVLVACVLGSIRSARPWRLRALFFVLAWYALLVKESALIPAGLGTLALAWDAWRHEGRARAAVLPLAAGLVTLAAAVASIVALCGGMENARELLRLTPEAWAPDDYLRHYQTGGVGYYVTGLALLQPLPWALGVLAALLAAARPRRLAGGVHASPAGLRLLALFTLGFLAVSCAYSSKNMRFLSPLYAPVAILAASAVVSVVHGIGAMASRRTERVLALVAALLLAGSAAADARRFAFWFNERQIQDLATPWFTEAPAPADHD